MPYFIRAAGSADVPAIAAIYAPFVLNSTATLELEPPDVAEVERRLRSVQQGGLPYLVAEGGPPGRLCGLRGGARWPSTKW